MLITDYLVQNSQDYPYNVVIVYISSDNYRKKMFWKSFDIMSNQVSNLFNSQNIKKG